jgi:peptidoglycan-N-acetylglucosamine deacetylase
MPRRPIASLSIDLDNKWSYLKTHGDPEWRTYPSFLDVVIPRMLEFLDEADAPATFFVVGADADRIESRDVLRSIAEAGHEIGNHSYHHEPWLHSYPAQRLREELGTAHASIETATGRTPVGFRGPGYSLSAETLRVLAGLGYRYDASTLPTFIGPLARRYYFRTAEFTKAEREERAALFGSWRDALRPIKPYRWGVEDGDLIEVPVTTMPLSRLPIHFSYVLYLSSVRPALARRYFQLALALCERRGVAPSLLLHPLEFIGGQDPCSEGLEFLAWTQTPYQAKLEQLHGHLADLRRRFDVQPILAQVDHLDARGSLVSKTPQLVGAAGR